MTAKCDNCGDEVRTLVIIKPEWWKFWRKESRICQRCDYNDIFRKNLSREQWDNKVKGD